MNIILVCLDFPILVLCCVDINVHFLRNPLMCGAGGVEQSKRIFRPIPNIKVQ